MKLSIAVTGASVLLGSALAADLPAIETKVRPGIEPKGGL